MKEARVYRQLPSGKFNIEPDRLYFYEYKGKHFRDFLYLETEKEFIEALKYKNSVFNTLEENNAQFMEIVNRYGAKLIEEVEHNEQTK
jgi:hypothetical protein